MGRGSSPGNPHHAQVGEIAEELRLNMKIGDVEYQGDRTKAIFIIYRRGRLQAAYKESGLEQFR
ncbi:MAG: hypothetical protein R2744_11990 [Bacteroidales bacterium]